MTGGMRAIIEVTDPWEFLTITGLEFVPGTIEALTEMEAKFRLEAPLNLDGQTMTVARITPRHTGHGFELPCTKTPANIVFRSNEHDKWYAAIGTLTIE